LTFTANQSDHCPHSQANLRGNAAYAEPFGAQGQRCFDLLGLALLDCPTTKLLTVSSSTGQSSHHSFSYHRSLKLSEHTEHLEHCPTGGSGRIEPLLMQEQIDPLGVEVRQEAQEIGEGAAKPIHTPSGDHIDLTPSYAQHQLIETRTFVASLSP
jgi:hypothetical protein